MSATALADERYVSITTFKRDGTPVSTPVWCAGDGGSLLVFTEADSWKVRRIRHDPHFRITPCSARGKPRGEPADADADINEDTTRARALLARKYGWMWRGYNLSMAAVRRVRQQAPPSTVTIRIVLR